MTLAGLVLAALASLAAGCGAPQGVKVERQTVPVASDPTPVEDAFTQAAMCQAWHGASRFTVAEASRTTHWKLASPRFANSLRLNYQVPKTFTIEANGRSILGDNAVRITADSTQIQRSAAFPLTLYALDLAQEHEGSTLSRMMISGPDGHEYPAWVLERDIAFAPNEPDAGVWTVHTLLFPLDDRYGKLQARYRRETAWRFRDLVRTVLTTARLRRVGAIEPGALEADAEATEAHVEAPAGASGVSAADVGPAAPLAGDDTTGIPELICAETGEGRDGEPQDTAGS